MDYLNNLEGNIKEICIDCCHKKRIHGVTSVTESNISKANKVLYILNFKV